MKKSKSSSSLPMLKRLEILTDSDDASDSIEKLTEHSSKRSNTSRSRGKLIVIEGLDKAGKTTQQQMILKQLANSAMMYFPNPLTQTWYTLSEFLAGDLELPSEAVHLLFVVNRMEMASHIEEVLNSGRHVICTRYVYSGLAYSVARGLDEDWCRSVERPKSKKNPRGFLIPDVIFFLDTEPSECSLRSGYGDQVTEQIRFQKSVRSNFYRMFEKNDRVERIAGKLTKLEVHRKIMKKIYSITNCNVVTDTVSSGDSNKKK